MIKASNKNIVLITTIIIMAAIAIVCIFVIIPKVEQIKSISDQIKKQKMELESRYQKGQNLKKAYENLSLIKNNQKYIFSSLIQDGQELEFITAMEETANDKNVKEKINLTPPDTKNKNQKIQPLNLQITLAGNYLDILRTINDIERLNYYIIINQLDFLGKKTDGNLPADETLNQYTGNQIINVTLTGQVYWLSKI